MNLPSLIAFVLLALPGPASTPRHELEPSVRLTAVEALAAATPRADEQPPAVSLGGLESPFESPAQEGPSPLGWVLGLWFGGSVVLVALWGLAGRLVGRQHP